MCAKNSRRKALAQRKMFLSALTVAALSGAVTRGQDTASPANSFSDPTPVNVMEMDLESLMRMQVTSVSRRPEELSDAAAAIYVITQEDIRRSGVTSIAEALRLAPGMEVARQDAHTWAISSRGFNDEFASQLLVLIDGRSVYTPLFAGVYWDVQDLMLEDVDRIEVIRGPGGTLWGANAVNGVINITTKSARDTQGVLLTGGAGSEEQGFGGVRYGGKAGENSFYRVYAKYFNRDESKLLGGGDAHDAWYMSRGGFRYDWLPNDLNTITFQGDIYAGVLDQRLTGVEFQPNGTPTPLVLDEDVEVSGGNILSRWTHHISDESEFALKLYYDRSERNRVVYDEDRDTFDIDLQHQQQIGSRNNLVWGLGYSVTSDELAGSDTVIFNPTSRTWSLYSAFIQDEITIVEDRLRLTLGTKIEHNDFTGWELQPNARLSWSVTERQTAWFAASRAISTPSRAEDDIRINRFLRVQEVPPVGPTPTMLSLIGSRDMDAKEVLAFELGYRIQPHDRVTFDAATFYNIYDNQRSLEAGAPFMAGGAPPDHFLVVPYTINNRIYGETYGFELATTWQAADWWRIKVNYTFWRMELHKENRSTDNLLEAAERDSPRHQIGVRSLMDLPHNLEFDTGVRYVDALPTRMRFVTLDNRDGIPSYFVADARLGWRPNRNWEVSLVAQNLLDKRHQEFAPSFLQTEVTEVETSVYAKITFRY